MKKTISVIVGFLFITGVNSQTVEQRISTIDKQSKEIKSKINGFKKVVKVEDNTGYNYVYLKDKELQLISVRSNEKNVDWYVLNGKIIYCEVVWIDYSTNKVEDSKTYFNNEHLIAWSKENGKFVDEKSKEFKDFGSEFEAFAPKWREKAMN